MKLNVKTSCKNINYDAYKQKKNISDQFWTVDVCGPLVVDVLLWFIKYEDGQYVAHEDMGGWSKEIYRSSSAQEVVDWMENNELKDFGDRLVWHETENFNGGV